MQDHVSRPVRRRCVTHGGEGIDLHGIAGALPENGALGHGLFIGAEQDGLRNPAIVGAKEGVVMGGDQPGAVGAWAQSWPGSQANDVRLRGNRAVVEPEIGLEPPPRHAGGKELDRVCAGGQSAPRQRHGRPANLGPNPRAARDQDAFQHHADRSVGLGSEDGLDLDRRVRPRQGARGRVRHQPASLGFRARRRDELAAMQHQVAVLDMNERFHGRALIGSQPKLRQDERPSMKLDERPPRRLGFRRPGEPFRFALAGSLDTQFQDQTIGQPHR